MTKEIKDLNKIKDELEFQLIVCEATGTRIALITYENACKLYAIVKGLIKNYTERKENGTH